MPSSIAPSYQRLLLLIPAALGVLLIIWCTHVLRELARDPYADSFRAAPRTRGETINFTALAPNESILIEEGYFHRSRARQYVVTNNPLPAMSIFECDISWLEQNHEIVATHVNLIGSAKLSREDLDGLGRAFQLLHAHPHEGGSAHPSYYRVKYMRNGREIGEERFYNPYFFKEPATASMPPEDRIQLALACELSLQDFDKLVTPYMLLHRIMQPEEKPAEGQ